jgi:CubicO group peptidase (beta-lactamase class C family)
VAVGGVSVRHLLTHSSGIVDALEIPIEPATVDERSDSALGQYLAGPFADTGYLMVPPGTFYNYSNPNYSLLGRLSELVTQQPFRTLLKEHVLLPLGMNRTFATADDVLRDGDFALGKGCDPVDANCVVDIIKPESFDQTWISPAGGVWSSVLDLSKIARFLVQGDEAVLAADQWQAMTSAQVSTLEAGDFAAYGYGVGVTKGALLGAGEFYDIELLSHSGGLPGYAANIICARRLDSCIITLASDAGAQFTNSIQAAFRTVFALPATSTPPELAVRQERYSSYVGTYRDAFDVGDVTISTNAGKLYASIPKFDTEETRYDSELAPLMGDSFVLTAAGMSIPITFIADGTGQYKYLRSRTSVPIRRNASAD